MNEAGKKHIIKLAQELSTEGIVPAKIFTSTLKRCIETTENIQEVFREERRVLLESAKREGLKEFYHGDWSKEKREWVEDMIAEQKKKFKSIEDKVERKKVKTEAKRELSMKLSTDGNRPGDAEKREAFEARIRQEFDEILEKESNNTFIVSHGGVIKKYLTYKKIFDGEISNKWIGDNRPALILTRIPDGELKFIRFIPEPEEF